MNILSKSAVILCLAIPASAKERDAWDRNWTARAAPSAADLVLKIVSADGAKTFKPRETLPPIRPGDTVSILSGKAVFESNGVEIAAGAGAAFTITIHVTDVNDAPGLARQANQGGLNIASTGNAPLTIVANGATLQLEPGKAVRIPDVRGSAGAFGAGKLGGADTFTYNGGILAPRPGGGTDGKVRESPSRATLGRVSVGDVNGDGKPEIFDRWGNMRGGDEKPGIAGKPADGADAGLDHDPGNEILLADPLDAGTTVLYKGQKGTVEILNGAAQIKWEDGFISRIAGAPRNNGNKKSSGFVDIFVELSRAAPRAGNVYGQPITFTALKITSPPSPPKDGAGSLTKAGPGTLVLNGGDGNDQRGRAAANAYNGTTSVNEGLRQGGNLKPGVLNEKELEKASDPPGSHTITATYSGSANFEAAAKKTLQELAEAYNLKSRSAFTRLLSEDFADDQTDLEDALAKDFRNYRSIKLELIPDNVAIQNLNSEVSFHYNLMVVDNQGASNKFSGSSNFVFRREGNKARLYKLGKPSLFGNSLPSPENSPASLTKVRPGESRLGGGASPLREQSAIYVAGTVTLDPGGSRAGARSAVRGSGTLTEGSAAAPGSGFKFDTQSNAPDASADIFKRGTLILVNPGSGIVPLGSCELGSDAPAPPVISRNSAEAEAGECYAVRTAANRLAALRVTSIGGSSIRFDYKFLPGGRSY